MRLAPSGFDFRLSIRSDLVPPQEESLFGGRSAGSFPDQRLVIEPSTREQMVKTSF